MHGVERSGARFWLAVALACAGGVLLALATLAAFGVATRLQGLHISVSRPAPVFVQAMVVLVAALLCDPRERSWTRAATWAALCGLLAALAADSTIRRVGDGHEYLAMALALSRGEAPGGTVDHVTRLNDDLAGEPGVVPGPLDAEVVTSDTGRTEFRHFWGYPLLAAPFVAAARLAGQPIGMGFLVLNLVLFALSVAALLRCAGPAATVLLVASPVLWWVDKAHPEVLYFAATSVALCSVRPAPVVAVLAAAVAAAQLPAFVVVWTAVTAACLAVHGPARRGLLPSIGASAAIVAAYPLYYLAVLGRMSPLLDAGEWHVPSLSRYLAPVVDLDVGVLIVAPALLVAGLVGVRSWRRLASDVTVAIAWLAAAVLLAIVAQSPNLNHAGTFGPSRYGIWLIACAAPWVAVATRDGAQAFWRLLAVAGMAASVVLARPGLGERYLVHSWPAQAALEAPLPWYAPPPEVFAERTGGSEEFVYLPQNQGACATVLLSGDRPDEWPVPCGPEAVPGVCRVPGQFCYAYRVGGAYRFRGVGPQPGFHHAPAPHAWSSPRDLEWVPARVEWPALVPVRAESTRSWIRTSEGLGPVYALQGERQLVAWITPRGAENAVTLRAPVAVEACAYAVPGHERLSCVALQAGSATRFPLPREQVVTVVAVPAADLLAR